MKTEELLTMVKAMPMPRILEALGVKPVGGGRVTTNGHALYCAPYREDTHPSMSVYQHNGQWLFKDHATGEYGTNIDIIVKMGICSSWRDAMLYIAQRFITTTGDTAAVVMAPFHPHSQESIDSHHTCCGEVTSIMPIKGSPAEKYITNVRCIPLEIALRYLSFIHYTYDGVKSLSGIGWPTINGGWAVRWPVDLGHGKGKGFVGRGGPSYFRAKEEGRTTACDVFEGVFDFLSFISWGGYPQRNDAIVLNSTENIKAAFPVLQEYDVLNVFMDYDTAGIAAMNTLKSNHQQHTINDMSTIYEGFNDFNEYLKNNRKYLNINNITK